MALMGFVENFLPDRIQILAQTELPSLATLSPQIVRDAIDRLFQFTMPVIVICKGLEVPPYLLKRANECQVPLLRSPMSTTPFIHSLTSYLDHMFAPSTTVHGSLVDVYGCGLLLGKSESTKYFSPNQISSAASTSTLGLPNGTTTRNPFADLVGREVL